MRAHIIENGIVTNTIEVESLDFLPNLVEATDGAIGWSYDGARFVPPDTATAHECPRFFGNSKLDLFTKEEQLAVVTTTMSDPVVKLMYDRLLGAAYLSYEDPETEQGLSLLVSKGLLTPARKAEIVSAMQPQH